MTFIDNMMLTTTEQVPELTGSDARLTRAPQASLTREEMHAVLARNSEGCVHHTLSDGAVRTSRVRYAHTGTMLYIPAWTRVESWYAARLPALECYVSEVDWRSCWRLIRLRGEMTPLHPTGAAREREAWRQGVAILRSVIPHMPPNDELAVANFGIVQMDIGSWDGAVVHWHEEIDSSDQIGDEPFRQ